MRPPRAPKFPYKGNPPYPHEMRGEAGPLVQDAVSGAWFPDRYSVDGPYGPVDGRDGGSCDLDADMHELSPGAITPPSGVRNG